jgi:hypothetical protein
MSFVLNFFHFRAQAVAGAFQNSEPAAFLAVEL